MLDNILADKEMISVLVQWGTMFVVSRLLNNKPLDESWLKPTLYTLAGFAIYYIVVKKVLPYNEINKALGDSDTAKTVVDTTAKYGVVFIGSRLLAGGKLDKEWMQTTLYQVLGFNLYEVVTKDVTPVDMVEGENMKHALQMIVMVATVAVTVRLLEGKSLSDQSWIMSSVYTAAGFVAYSLGTSMLIK